MRFQIPRHETPVLVDTAFNQKLLERIRIQDREVHGRLFPVQIIPMGASGVKEKDKNRSKRIRKHR